MKIRILIADDHAVLRMGLRLVINSQVDMEVVGEASNGESAATEAERLRPDVVLLDLTMGAHSGVTAIGEVLKMAPDARILVLTMHTDPAYLRTAMAAGATGYVMKNSDDSELLMAIREVAQGRRFIDHGLDPMAIADLHAPRKPKGNGADARSMGLLSNREREVFSLVAQGFTNQQIADQLKLSVKSVETYRSRFMEKLALRSRAEVVKYALDCGVLSATK